MLVIRIVNSTIALSGGTKDLLNVFLAQLAP